MANDHGNQPVPMEVSALSFESSSPVVDLDLVPEAEAAEAIADDVPFEGSVTSNVIERRYRSV